MKSLESTTFTDSSAQDSFYSLAPAQSREEAQQSDSSLTENDAAFLHHLDYDCVRTGRTAHQYELLQTNPNVIWTNQNPVGIPDSQQRLEASNGFFHFHTPGFPLRFSDPFLSTQVRLLFCVLNEQHNVMIARGRGSLIRTSHSYRARSATVHDEIVLNRVMAEAPIARGGYKQIYKDYERPNEFVWSRMNCRDQDEIVKEVQLCYLCSALSAVVPN